ncbi:MAG: GNAT family N-acetyltransferase [Bacillota bacterium]
MRRIETILAYADLVQAFKTSHATVWTNCFMLPAEIERNIVKKRMRVTADLENLLIWIAEEYCDRLYYYTATLEPLDKQAFAEFAGKGRPVALDIVTKHLAAGAESTVEAKWKRSGFGLHSVYQRMTVSAANAAACLLSAAPKSDAPAVRTLDESRIPEILGLWRICLDSVSIARPDADKLRELMAQNRVLYIISRENVLCAAMVSLPEGKKAAIDHVAVHPSYRRQGLARALVVSAMQRDLQNGVDSFYLWVDHANEPAIRLYEELGFTPDGTQSRLFILKQPV